MDLKIVQIFVAPGGIWGLGDDYRVYIWNPKTVKWDLVIDERKDDSPL